MVLAIGLMETSSLAIPGPCAPENPGSVPRPVWSELALPNGSGYPDYENVSHNLQILNSIQLLASLATRAAQSLQNLDSQVEDAKAKGRCVCCLVNGCVLPEIYSDIERQDCTAAMCNALEGANYPIWLPTDVFKTPGNAARFTLKYIGFLDKLQTFLQPLASDLQALGSGLANLNQLIASYLAYVDLLTEGYHLGGYSTERPDLHLCVGYGGHGAFAEMVNLFGVATIGGRYTSENLSAEHRAQFRAGGFAVTAFGHALSLLPGIQADLQIDGFKLWDVNKPFGIDLSAVGVPSCIDGAGFPISDIDKYDIFSLIDSQSDLVPFDHHTAADPPGAGDGCLQPGEFLIHGFHPAFYLSNADGLTHTWPRPTFSFFDWERQNTAVVSAGLNLPLDMTPIEKDLAPIPVFTGATLYPKLTMKAGVHWTHETNALRTRLQEAINKNLPAVDHLGPNDFERPMHFLQAPDLSDDDGTSAYVQPGVAADLLIGIRLRRYLSLGITASVGTGLDVEPAAHGGVHDLNVALADTLLNSNPPPNLPCDPVLHQSSGKECSNGLQGSDATYSCDTSQIVIFHCKEPEQRQTCKPETAATDCPRSEECVAEYGCAAHGICERDLDVGPDGEAWTDDDTIDVTQDTTYDACVGAAVCDDAAVNEGAPCTKDSDCFGPLQCVEGPNANQPCMTDSDCPRGHCKSPPVSCVVISPVGYFTPYQCVVHSSADIIGWQGPGCHPLSNGFPSACGCAVDADCVAGVETCASGACAVASQPVTCTCDPTVPNTCGSGRVCDDGACVLDCSANGVADCAANEVCTNGACVNPYGIPFSEQVFWQVKHTKKPQHAVASYSLSDIKLSAILNGGLLIGLDFKFSGHSHHFDLVNLSHSWVLAAFNKSWYQPGLEARYQNDCDPVSGDTVSNWQPGSLRVKRYNPNGAPSGSLGNAGTLADLEQWCKAELPLDVSDPAAPDQGSIESSAVDVMQWGEDIGADTWNLAALCVRSSGEGEATSTPLAQWLSGVHANPAAVACSYTYNNQTYSFPCADLEKQLLLIWGCLDVATNPWAPLLASGFPAIVTTFNGHPVIDLNSVLVDPDAELTLANVQPQILNYGFNVGHFWYQVLTQCFEQKYAAVQPGDIQLGGVLIEPCCGNGQIDNGGCAEGLPPCEQCDDGPNNGATCSTMCQIQGRPIPLGYCGNGILERNDLEECDDGNNVSGDGCEADCTLPVSASSPSPTPTATLQSTSTRPPGATPTRTPRCIGNCDGVGGVTQSDLRTAVDVALGLQPPDACDAFEGIPSVTIDALVSAVRASLSVCAEASP